MGITPRRAAGFLMLALTSAFHGCSGGQNDLLVGTWNFKGSVPAIVDVTLVFEADHTFTLTETVAPASRPAGYDADGCVTTDTYYGRYSADGQALALEYLGGTRNAVSGCNAASTNTTGQPVTAESVNGSIEQGLIPPTHGTYGVSETALSLPMGNLGGTFSRVR